MMRLYVWHNVLLDWDYGIAFAFADSPEDAKQILIDKGLDEWHWDGLRLDRQEYEVYDAAYADFVYGSA